MRPSRLFRLFPAPTLALVAALTTSHASLAGGSKAGLRIEDISSGATPTWSEAIVEVSASESFRGRVEVSPDSFHGSGDRVLWRRDVTANADASTELRVPIHGSSAFYVRLVADDGSLVAEQPVSRATETDDLIMVTDGVDVPVHTRITNASVPQRDDAPAAGIMRLRAGTLPAYSWTYEDVALFVAHGASLKDHSAASCAPLVSWLRQGGSLVVVDEEARPYPCGLTADQLGNGAIQWSTRAALGAQMDALYTSARARHFTRRDYIDPTQIFLEKSHPQVAWGALVLFSFSLAVPIIFVRLRRRRRVDAVFVVLPALSVAAFTGIVAIGRLYRPEPHTRTVIARELTGGEPVARERRARAFIRPTKALRVHPALEDSLVLSADDRFGSYRLGPRGYGMMNADGSWTLNGRGDIEDLAYFIELGHKRMPGAIDISCSKRDECTVVNRTGAPLRDVTMRFGSRGLFAVPDIDRESTFSLDTRLSSERASAIFSDPVYATFDSSVALLARQELPGDPVASSISVACVRGCEVAR